MRRHPTPSASSRNSTGSPNRGSTTMSARHGPPESSRELGTLEISSQSIINQSAQLSTGAAKALAQGIGPFLEKYGTHFVAGYIYGKRCNISYQLEFSSIDLATKFSGSYQESATELGFTETTHANISNALSKSSSHCTVQCHLRFSRLCVHCAG